MTDISPLLTLIIPTYNRDELLRRTLSFVQRRSVRCRVILADGSSAEYAARNAELCRALGDNIVHLALPTGTKDPWQNYSRRVAVALEMTATPYVAYCADDDLFVTETAVKSAEFLETHRDYAACHGSYLHFRYAGDLVSVENVTYDGPSIDGDDVCARYAQFFSRYEAPFYAVYRVAAKAQAFTRYQEVERPLWPEIYHSTSTIIGGKVKRLDDFYCLRHVGVRPYSQAIDSFIDWAATDLDDFHKRYVAFRERATAWAKDMSGGRFDEATLRRALDMSFMVYVGQQFHAPHWIAQYLSGFTSEGTGRAALQARLEQNLAQGHSTALTQRERLGSIAEALIGTHAFEVLRSVKRRFTRPDSFDTLMRENGFEIAPRLKNRYAPARWAALCAPTRPYTV